MSTRRLGVIAGSGLEALGERFGVGRVIDFASIPGVGAATVAGHAGEIRVARDVPVVVVAGRRHVYENAADAVDALVGVLAELGVDRLVTTSAAGALHGALSPGDLVRVTDVIDLQGARAASGARRGARTDSGRRRALLDEDLACALEHAARRRSVAMRRGVLACMAGPAFETAAEVAWLRRIGADVATMSAAPEIRAARRRGLRVAAVAVVTNPATGVGGQAPRHDAVLETAREAAGALADLVADLVAR